MTSTVDDEVAALRRIPLFSRLDGRRLKMLALSGDRMSFAVGQNLCRQGEHGDCAFVILAGTVDVLVERADGSELQVNALGKNALVGELAILCDIPRTATVRATGPVEVLRIERDDFLDLLKTSPEASIEVIRSIGLRLAGQTAERAR